VREGELAGVRLRWACRSACRAVQKGKRPEGSRATHYNLGPDFGRC